MEFGAKIVLTSNTLKSLSLVQFKLVAGQSYLLVFVEFTILISRKMLVNFSHTTNQI